MAEISSNMKNGEIVITEVPRVLRYSTKDFTSGDYGVLCVTNFRITFVPAEHPKVLPAISIRPNRENRCIPLTSVHKLYAAVRSPGAVFGRQKVVLTKSIKVNHIQYIEVETKDFHVHRFGTQFADDGDASLPQKGGHLTTQQSPMMKLVLTLLQHCFPKEGSYLFARDFTPTLLPCSPSSNSPASSNEGCISVEALDSPADVLRNTRQRELVDEMQRCGISNDERWSIAENREFAVCEEYPALVIVPLDLQNEEFALATRNFQGQRFPIWCWSNASTGTWLTRAAKWTGPTGEENVFGNAFNRQDPLAVIDTTKVFTASRVHDGFEKLLAACHYERGGYGKLLENEASWMSTFDDTRWPELVQGGVALATEVVESMRAGSNVLVEGKASCHAESLVVSLAQMMMDPMFRTKAGFDLLVRKEWVATGFPFLDFRSKKHRQCPLFLVFLDGVHQIMRQYPTAFEFSEAYLCVVWHDVLSGLWRDFVLDSDMQRVQKSSDFALTTSYWTLNGPTFENAEDPCVNIMYRYDPDILQVSSQGWDIVIWGRCFLPQTLGGMDAGQQAIRLQMTEKLTSMGRQFRRRAGLLAALGREDTMSMETYIADHHIPVHLATLMRHDAQSPDAQQHNTTVV
eukprot:m.882969 g.882969  ORF g.882969 m.882969 type:complete len:630 (-) comp23601_c0_seq3:447-2336(-)